MHTQTHTHTRNQLAVVKKNKMCRTDNYMLLTENNDVVLM